MKTLFFTAILAISSLTLTAQKSISYKTTEEKLNDEYCSGLFKSTDGTILDVAANPSAISYFNILDWLQGRVAGLQIYTTKNGTRIPVIRGQISTIYVDENPVSAGFLNALSSSDIAMIKVIKTPFLGGFNGSGGAIAIYTLKGEDEEEESTHQPIP